MRGVSESFKRRADSAAFWEAWVGSVLARAGLYTLHFPFEVDGSDSHGTTFDLMVGNSSDIVGAEKVEIKSLSLKFTSTSDYPFRDVMVCSDNSFRKKWPGAVGLLPRDFLLVSTETGSIVWVPAGSKVWPVRTEDKDRRETYCVQVTDKSSLKELYQFVEYING